MYTHTCHAQKWKSVIEETDHDVPNFSNAKAPTNFGNYINVHDISKNAPEKSETVPTQIPHVRYLKSISVNQEISETLEFAHLRKYPQMMITNR